jgi:hypothetical protein
VGFPFRTLHCLWFASLHRCMCCLYVHVHVHVASAPTLTPILTLTLTLILILTLTLTLTPSHLDLQYALEDYRRGQRDRTAAAEVQASQEEFDARTVAHIQATEAAAVRAARLVRQEQELAAAVQADRQRRAAEPLGSVQLMVAGPSSRVRPPPLDEEDELSRTILEMVTAADGAEEVDSSSRQRCLRQPVRAERRQRERDEQICRLLGDVAARERANVQAKAQSATATAEAAELAEQRAAEAAERAVQRANEAHRAAAEAVKQWSRSALAPQLRNDRQARRVAASVLSVFAAEASVYATS